MIKIYKNKHFTTFFVDNNNKWEKVKPKTPFNTKEVRENITKEKALHLINLFKFKEVNIFGEVV